MTQRTCSIDGCTNPSARRGWCGKHYARWYRTGDPNITRCVRNGSTVTESFLHTGWTVSASGCWEWNGGHDSSGYGALGTATDGSKKAHRVSYEHFKGDIPNGMLVCHSCDNRNCVNPEHLWLGSIANNNADRDAKKRQSRGSNSPQAKLTEQDVVRIRLLWSSGERNNTQLSKMFGVSSGRVSDIVNRKSWKHV